MHSTLDPRILPLLHEKHRHFLLLPHIIPIPTSLIQPHNLKLLSKILWCFAIYPKKDKTSFSHTSLSMRGGSLGVQQALTPEAGNMVKQAMVLASQRGHAQVTPLHVATTMLSAATGLLRAACLQSHTHPLQCRALELCFNVSLNRLQTSTRSSMLVVPCISNSLVAAFKRAQAHNRRGSLENPQQQPILAVKIEPEQLVISILDDPGVSRVMREAGFSSPQVKSKVEQYVSLKMCSDKPKPNISSSSSSSSLNTSNPTKPDSRLFVPKHDNELTTTLVLNSAASNKDPKEVKEAFRFKEMNAENLKTLCDALRSKAPRHKDVIPDIANAILKCRTRSIPRKLGDGNQKEETWLYFQGKDVESKEKIGRELAKLVFGSHNSFVSISLSSSSTEGLEKKKRKRDEDSLSYTQRLFEAVSCDPHRVFFVEDIEEADYLCQMGFKRAIERGKLQNKSGEEALLKDAIVILSSTERFSSKSRASSPPEPCISLDLNLSLDHGGHHNDHIVGLLDTVDAHILFSGSSI